MKRPFVTKEQLDDIIRQFPTPFHLYDEAGIRATVRRLHAAFAWAPGFKEYFAVKANPNPTILSILKEEGCGVDCASLCELMLAGETGFAGEDIMFSSNATPPGEFALAGKLGAIIDLDDISHIGQMAEEAGVPETVCLRYNPGEGFVLHTRYMSHPDKAKYGFTLPQLKEGVARLQKMGVKHFGLHAFLVTNTLEADYFPALARVLFETAAQLHKELSADIAFINLSGGIGIPYRPDQEPCSIGAAGRAVQRVYEEIMAPAGLGRVPLCTELGRYVLGPHGHLVATVLHEKNTYRRYLGLDACAADLIRPAMYGAYHHITVAGKEGAPATESYDVTGSLCENNDKFAVARPLPPTGPGDVVVIHDTGAHGHAMGYNYNGRLRSAEVLLREDGSVRLIRRAETPEDYFATVRGFGCSL